VKELSSKKPLIIIFDYNNLNDPSSLLIEYLDGLYLTYDIKVILLSS